jgi:REP element-mobilizing transposase RayT
MDKPRNFYKNTFHHIYNRGAFQKNIFYDKADYDYFLRLLKKYKDKYFIEILCYCLMPNHYHLFTKQTKEEFSTSKFIADFNNSFTKGINKKYKRSGVLFEGKTKSKIIKDESYFKWVIKYILENPVKANLVNNFLDYDYSSAKEIMGINSPVITSINELLSFFDSLNSFRTFMLDQNQKYSYEF